MSSEDNANLLAHIDDVMNQLLEDVREMRNYMKRHENDCGEERESAWSRFKARFKVWVAGGRSS